MPFYFPGFPAYLERAMKDANLSDPKILSEARKSPLLTRVADLVTAAAAAPSPDVAAGILANAKQSEDAADIVTSAIQTVLIEAHYALVVFPRLEAETRAKAKAIAEARAKAQAAREVAEAADPKRKSDEAQKLQAEADRLDAELKRLEQEEKPAE